jgi:signal transduction histidine kinase
MPVEPIYVEADVTRLSQVFANLLSNAIKCSELGGVVTLTADRDGSEAVVRVRDEGHGIEPEMLERIFEPFVQSGPSREAGLGGLGIGLTLARRLVEMHGGRLVARSEGLGRGAEFTVTLPLQ